VFANQPTENAAPNTNRYQISGRNVSNNKTEAPSRKHGE
jgi:hypothetical protein